MEYEDFELQIGPRSREGLLVRVLRSPAGEGEALVHLPETPGASAPLAGVTRNLAGEACGLSSSPADAGGDLFRSVFTGQVAALFQRSLSRIEAPLRGLRIRLRINLRDRTVADLQSLPWELLYREDTEDFLALSRWTPIVRALDVPRPAALRRYEPPLRILAILARDPEGSPLSLEEELKELRQALNWNPAIQLEVLEDPDTRTIRGALGRGAFHILHYMGHGVFEPGSGEGALLFGSPEGRLPVTGRHLATKVKDFDELRLVVLNACETAIVGGEAAQGPFAGVAAALVLGGVPAVVAMQSAIGDAHAVAFTSAFYERLAAGMPVEEAVTEGRQAIHSLEPDESSWAIPVLFLRAAGDLFAQEREGAPEPEIEIPSPPARQRGGLLARTLVPGLLAVALGVGLVNQLGDRTSSGSRSDAASVPPATELKARTQKADPEQHPPLPRPQTKSPASPSRDTPTTGRSSRMASMEGCGLRLEIVGTPPAGFSTGLCRATKQLDSAGFPVAGRIARIEVGPSDCPSMEVEGVPGTSCTLEALIRLREGDVSRELPSVSVEAWQPNAVRARSTAAEKLVSAVAAHIAKSL